MIAEKCKLFMPLRRQSWLAESNYQAYVDALSAEKLGSNGWLITAQLS